MVKLPYKKLLIWQKGMNICTSTYALTQSFPKEETYGIIQQIRRAAVSIPSNIAEGSQRKSAADFRNFLRIAKGSLAELETQLLLSIELNFTVRESIGSLLQDIDRLQSMIYSFESKLTSAF